MLSTNMPENITWSCAMPLIYLIEQSRFAEMARQCIFQWPLILVPVIASATGSFDAVCGHLRQQTNTGPHAGRTGLPVGGTVRLRHKDPGYEHS